jgi:hypothetical protein
MNYNFKGIWEEGEASSQNLNGQTQEIYFKKKHSLGKILTRDLLNIN